MAVRTDNRLQELPPVPVRCRRCAAEVLVRKSSWQQTSIQWNAQATARCPQRRQAAELNTHGGGVFLACSDLRDSIDEAVNSGTVRIVDEASDAPDGASRS
ncbi:ferredoxin [Mycolicibacterium pulveris]|uniref:ferredoxin n=1 Tax=Mycolicibacterium pulveris TaxID=36813 RepID=UPI003CF81389